MGVEASVSDLVGKHLRELRTRAGMSQEDLAAATRQHGAGESFSGTVVSFLESGRRKDGRRTRLFGVDEVPPLAAALQVSPLELLGPGAAELFVGGTPSVQVKCPSCAAGPTGLEAVTRADLANLGDLSTLEATLVETAFRLAAAIDETQDETGRALPALTKELRATLEQLATGRRRASEPDEDEFGDLDEPG